MGQDIPVYKSENLSFGIQMCYDAHFPRLSEAMAIKGIDLIFFPHASPRCSSREKLKSWMRHLPARAFDNSIYVLACNQTGRNKSGLTFPGVALCIDPSGNLVDKKFSASDSLLTSRIDLEKIEEVRGHRMKYFLPNTRADIYDS
jgi:N-carbamoylputrescine amidase